VEEFVVFPNPNIIQKMKILENSGKYLKYSKHKYNLLLLNIFVGSMECFEDEKDLPSCSM